MLQCFCKNKPSSIYCYASPVQVTGVWASNAWAAAKRITTALRTALCGMSLSPVVTVAEVSQQELVAAALLIAAGRMAGAILNWWWRCDTFPSLQGVRGYTAKVKTTAATVGY
jgi:hypothetical protein